MCIRDRYNYLPQDRARAQQMFLEAGLLDVVVDSTLLSGFQKLCLPNEDTVSKLGLAARLQALPAPTVHRVFEPTARELSAARLLHMFVWIHHSHEGHPRPGMMYDAGFTGLAFGDVVDMQGHQLPWRQLLIEHPMRPMIAAARGLVRGRSGTARAH